MLTERDFSQDRLAFLGAPKERENLVNYVRLRVFFYEAVVPRLGNHVLCQLAHLLPITAFYTLLTLLVLPLRLFLLILKRQLFLLKRSQFWLLPRERSETQRLVVRLSEWRRNSRAVL